MPVPVTDADSAATSASETLRVIGLLDSPQEQSYDRLTRLAAAALHVPVSLITLIDGGRQFFKSSAGLPEPWASSRETPMEYSICRHVVTTAQPLVVEDTRAHPLLRESAAVTELGLVAYAGLPLRTMDGQVIGAFAAADHAPHAWSPAEIALLEELAAAAMHEIELHAALRTASRQTAAASDAAAQRHCAPPQFRTLVDEAPIGICALQDGLFQFVNGALAHTLLYSEEELTAGVSVLDLVVPSERAAMKEALQQAMRGPDRTACHEFTALRKDRTTIRIEMQSARSEIAGRRALVAYLFDVTARTRSDAERRRHADQLRALTENAWDVVHMLSPDDVMLYISPSVERVLGYRAEEMIGKHSREFVHPDDLARADEAFRQDIVRPGARRSLELRLRHKDGSWRDVEVVGQVITDPGGSPVAIVNTHDVTQQKRTERELRQKSASVELLEYVATAANEATSVRAAIEPCLARICTHHGWCVAHVCLRDARGNLVSTGIWYLSDPVRFAAFKSGTEAEVFAPGVGLPGAVLATGTTAWRPDVTEDAGFSRRRLAREAGLRGGIACPLLVGTEVVGVLEFFAERALAVDDPLRETLTHVGTQLGRVVERQQAHDALMASEGRIRAVVEMAHDAFVATDASGVLTEWNTQAEAIFGWSRDEAIGRRMEETIIPQRHRAAHRRGVRRFLRTGKYSLRSRRLEIEALHRDGHEFPVELSITAIPVDGGYVFTSFLHDITARKQAEEKLRLSEERYDLVARATSDVVFDWNVVTGVLTWNKAIQRTCRYQPDQVGSTMEWWYNHIHPTDRERVVTGTHAVLNGTREFWSDEYRFQRGDGSYATVLARGHVVRNDRGEAVRMIGSMVDITERTLEEEGQRFIAQASALLDTSLDQEVILGSLARLAVPTLADYCVIDVLDESGTLHRTATAHADPSKESVLRAVEHQASDPDPDHDLILTVMRTRQPMLVRDCSEAVLDSLDLHPAHREALRRLEVQSFMVVPLLTRERMLGTLTFGSGASGRHYDLMDLLTAEQLAQRAARTIDNGRLYDNAQRAIRARDEVLAVVSHDLRNPLSTISLSASMLLDESTERRATGARFLQVIKRSADQASTMIKNLLDVSSIEAGHFSVTRSQEDVGEIMSHAQEMLAPLAEKKAVRLECALPTERLVASADVNQLQRVFSNLIGNAIKFTPKGGTVTLRAGDVDGELRFSVSDTGPGIPAEQLPHVFDRFWQGRQGDRRGAGLGLSIARGIVEAHGGRIWVESPAGQGATFFFTVPLQRPPDAADSDPGEQTGEHVAVTAP
jgi:PAS domain S-box-containing protein